MDKEFFLQLLVEWAAFEHEIKRYHQKIYAVAKKAGISQQVISYHLQKRKEGEK